MKQRDAQSLKQQNPNNQNNKLTLGDWLSFLEARRNSCINIIYMLAIMLVFVIIGLVGIFSQQDIEEDKPKWILFLAIGFIVMIGFYVWTVIRFGRPYEQAAKINELIVKIVSEEIKEPYKIKKEWFLIYQKNKNKELH